MCGLLNGLPISSARNAAPKASVLDPHRHRAGCGVEDEEEGIGVQQREALWGSSPTSPMWKTKQSNAKMGFFFHSIIDTLNATRASSAGSARDPGLFVRHSVSGFEGEMPRSKRSRSRTSQRLSRMRKESPAFISSDTRGEVKGIIRSSSESWSTFWSITRPRGLRIPGDMLDKESFESEESSPAAAHLSSSKKRIQQYISQEALDMS